LDTPTLTDAGLLYRRPSTFITALEWTLEQSVSEIAGGCEDWEFPRGAARLAGEVFASGLEWAPFAEAYGEAGRRGGMSSTEVAELLDLAWKWAPRNPAHWIQMCREWINDESTQCFYHLPSGERIEEFTYLNLFNSIWPDPEFIAVIDNYILYVANVTNDCAEPRGFIRLDKGFIFNDPRQTDG
jgi:hypothetical protein